MLYDSISKALRLTPLIAAAACSGDRAVAPSAGGLSQLGDSAAVAAISHAHAVTLFPGQTVRLRPRSTRTDRLRWTSSARDVASVDAGGTVRAGGTGSATIQAAGIGVIESWRVTVQNPTVTSFSLSPKSGATLAPGQSRQFAVTTTWSDGANRPAPVSFSSTGGTINNSGLFSAGSVAGTFVVVASCLCTPTAMADTAVVSVAAPPQLTRLTLSPKKATVQPGESIQFEAKANWATGATDLPPLTWSASSGSISKTGNYSAPTAGGTYQIIVSHAGGALKDTALVTVSGSTPPPAEGSFTPNLPAGMTLVVDTRFGNMRAAGVYNEDNLTLHYDARNAINETGPFGRNVFEIFYPGNSAGNGATGGWLMGRQGQKWKRLYFSIMVWVPPNYSTHSVGEKFFYPGVTTEGQPYQASYVDWKRIGDDTPNGPTFGLGLVTQTTNRPTKVWTPKVPASVRVTKGRWTRIEVYWTMNSVGREDGIFRAWIDGQLAADFSNVLTSAATAESYFDGIRFTGTRGGGVSNTLTPPEGQVRHYNRLAFYASPN